MSAACLANGFLDMPKNKALRLEATIFENKVEIKDPSVSNISPKVTVNNGTGTINFEAHLDSNNQFNSISLGSQGTYNDETFSKVGTKFAVG